MAIVLDITSVKQNHRGIYFEFTGDGSTTAITVSHGRVWRPGMAITAVVCTAPTKHDTTNSTGGGHTVPTGTNAAVATAVVNTGGTITVTTTAAVANGTRAYCNVVHGGGGLE